MLRALQWPTDRLAPQISIEFEVPNAAVVGPAARELQQRWLRAATPPREDVNYYGVPGNSDAIIAFRTQATRHWCHALRRRSQRHQLDWERMNRLAYRWLPPARVTHPYPEKRFDAKTQGRSPVR